LALGCIIAAGDLPAGVAIALLQRSFFSRSDAARKEPSPNPLPEYRARGKREREKRKKS
jgi:hypothetical protein